MRASPTDPEDAFLSRSPDLDCKTKDGQPSATGLKTRKSVAEKATYGTRHTGRLAQADSPC